MAKCDRHIDTNDFEWCWKCQELTDKERFESIKSLNKLQEIKFEDVFNDEKRESVKQFILEHKQKTKMKVIFLDNDGVICLSSNWGGRSKKWAKYRSANPETSKLISDGPVSVRFDNFDQKAIKILNEILEETGAEIVVSSDWRFHANLEELGEYYTSQGISKKPIGFTKRLGECDVPENFIWSRQWDLEQTRSLEILQYLRDHPEVTEWVAVDDLNMGIPQTHETWGDMEMDWGLNNFVLTPKSNEGIKQSGIKEKIIKYLIDDTTESNS